MTDGEQQVSLLLWNPSNFRWTELDADIARLERGEAVEDRWSCGGTKSIRRGSRFYLLRTGMDGGIVGSGKVTRDVFQGEHWQPDKAKAGQKANYIGVTFSSLSKTPLVTTQELRKPPFNLAYTPQQSGTTIRAELVSRLDQLWSQRVKEQGANKTSTSSASVFQFPKGARVFGFRPERSKQNTTHYAAVVADCVEHECVPMGWGHKYDLAEWGPKIKGKLERDGESPQSIAMLDKYRSLQVGDFVIIPQGKFAINGIGRVTDPYCYKADSLESLRGLSERDSYWWNGVTRVEWIPNSAGFLGQGQPWPNGTFFGPFDAEYLPVIEESIGHPTGTIFTKDGAAPATNESSAWVGSTVEASLARRVQDLLGNKGTHSVLLFGPAGTGKTYHAEKVADFYGSLKSDRVEFVQFHPAYAYEDFMEGLRPKAAGGGVQYDIEDGAFKRFCDKARGSNEDHLFIIDEINRGNIAKVMGELMYCLEYRGDKHSITLPYSRAKFSIPDNVHVLGTMNSSDRSIATLDVALRRRFQFVELAPDPDGNLLGNVKIADTGLTAGTLLRGLNDRILPRQGRHKLIGHSYFLPDGFKVDDDGLGQGSWKLEDFKARWFHQIQPLLEEYFADDAQTLVDSIIGPGWGEVHDRQHFVPFASDKVDFLSSLKWIATTVKAPKRGSEDKPGDEE